MWRFITSLILFICPLVMQAQLFKKMEVGRSPFVRLSVDPTVSLKTFLQEADMYGFEATIDAPIRQNLFLIGGAGFLNTSMQSDDFSYGNSGVYALVGADVNLTKYQSPKDREMLFVGLRYGFATLSHVASGIKLENEWGSVITSVDREALTASWLELAFGIKVEFAKNLFLGWTGEAKFRVHQGKGEMTPYNIPGFGKNNKFFAFDMNIYLSYAFTMKPKKAPPISVE